MDERWAIYVDEEGFASHWDSTMAAFQGLNALMEAIIRIGQRVYPNEGDRLFAYQFGDAFLISSDFHEIDLSRAALVTIAILRHMLAYDRVARASLSEGEIADVAGCYPKEVRDLEDRHRVPLGAGLLFTSSILGEGLLRTVYLCKTSQKGPLFFIPAKMISRLKIRISNKLVADDIASINWLKGEPPGLNEIQQRAGLIIETEDARIKRITDYIDRNKDLDPKWKEAVDLYLLS